MYYIDVKCKFKHDYINVMPCFSAAVITRRLPVENGFTVEDAGARMALNTRLTFVKDGIAIKSVEVTALLIFVCIICCTFYIYF